MEKEDIVLLKQVAVFEEGIGAVCPTGEVSNEMLASAVYSAQQPIEDNHVVCIDERKALELQPVRAKMAGGNVTTAFAATELANWSLYTDEQRNDLHKVRVSAVAGYLVSAGEKLGGHIDNHATEQNSNCGAADGYPTVISIIAQRGHDLEFTAQMSDTLGEHFDSKIWDDTVEKASILASDKGLLTWNGNTIINAVRKYNGVIEILNGDNTRTELDPNNSRHNHWAEGVAKNLVPGMSNNRDGSNIPFFQVDVPKIVETCQKMAKNEAEFARLLHGAAAYQFGVRYKLTSGQRNIEVR